jgi:hypothetical protein
MRIVFQGKIPEKKLWHGTCTNCKTVVECVQSEIRTDRGEKALIYTVKCPTDNCGETITLNEGKYVAYL